MFSRFSIFIKLTLHLMNSLSSSFRCFISHYVIYIHLMAKKNGDGHKSRTCLITKLMVLKKQLPFKSDQRLVAPVNEAPHCLHHDFAILVPHSCMHTQPGAERHHTLTLATHVSSLSSSYQSHRW